MTRGKKIALVLLAVLLGAGAAAFISADVLLSRFAWRCVDSALATLPEAFGSASCGTIQIRLFSGTAGISNLHYEYRGEPLQPQDTLRPGASITIDHIEIGRLFYSMLLHKELVVSDLYISEPRVELWLDEEHPERSFPTLPKDSTAQPKPFPLRQAALWNLHLKNASLALHSVRTQLDVAADSLSLTVHDLSYDTAFHYCDSVFSLSLAHASVLTPDSSMRIEARGLEQENQGPLTLASTRIANTMPRNRLAEMVHEPVTWIDMRVGQVSVSPFNPVRKALAKDLTLDTVTATVEHMEVYRDARYAPKEPFAMPQQILMALPVSFAVSRVNAQLRKIDISLATTEKNIGRLSLRKIRATATGISNRKGAVMRVSGSCPVEKGKAQARFSMTMNTACDFSASLHATDIPVSFLNPLVRPLVGITADCRLDTLDTEYRGDRKAANGIFCMQYKGLHVQVHKEDDIPYEVIKKHAKTFTALGNSLLTKSNPSSVDICPRAYHVAWTRNEWQPFPLYLFGPCIDGVKKTFLPGLYVHTQVKHPKKK